MPRMKLAPKLVAGGLVLLAVIIAALHSRPRVRFKLPAGRGVPAISLGERHGLILASDGSLWTWGSDFVGWPVLGLGNLASQSATLRQIGHETNWVGVSAGMSHSLAVKSDGSIWTWGESVGARSSRVVAIPAPVRAAPGNDWKQAAAGGVHSVALKRDGTLWAWGNNWAGAVGIPSANGTATPVQVGASTNWTKVWAGILETVALRSDGSLWYWGENPDPAFAQNAGQIFAPARVGADTNWTDFGFGVNTVFGIKSDGSLWVWGRQADVYTGATNTAMDAIPVRLGKDSDWSSISASTGWWRQGLTKRDGSLWIMDASDGKPNGPRPPYKPPRFVRVNLQKDWAAYAGGAVHGAAPGVHGPIGVALTRDGEVWTWGVVLGDPPTMQSRFVAVAARFAGLLRLKAGRADPPPVVREKPWLLQNE